jgi:hypothetical protein
MPRSCRFDSMTMGSGFDAVGGVNKTALWPEHGPCLLYGHFRPRTFDAERYASEQKSWQRWHPQQAQDEAEFDQT